MPLAQWRKDVERAVAFEHGIYFTPEQEVFARDGWVAPDVFAVGRERRMHVFSLKEGATIIARSRDRLNFEYLRVL